MNSTSESPAANSSLSEVIWHYFTQIANFYIVYVTFVSLIFGFFGNVCSVFIFYLKRNVDRVSAGYLGPLAFVDVWNVGQGCFYWLVLGAGQMTDGAFGLDNYTESGVPCWFQWFCAQCFMALSGWILLAFSIERCLVVWFPLKMTAVLTPSKRLKVVIAIFCCMPIFLITLITEEGYFYGDETWIKACIPSYDAPPVLMFLFWFIAVGFGAAIPCCSLLVTNFLILAGVRKSFAIGGKHDKNASQNEKRCLKNLLLVSSFYLIFMSPYSVFWVWVAVSPTRVPYVTELAYYSLNWAIQNYCVNPILYCYSLPWYRRTMITILTCGLVREKKTDDL